MKLFSATLGGLKKSLSTTRSAITAPLRALSGARTIDADVVEAIRNQLITADVGVAATDVVIKDLTGAMKRGELHRGEEVIDLLRRGLITRFGDETPELVTSSDRPTVVLVAGVNGVGKTTSIAKIASAYAQQGKSVLLAAADTYRAGAVEQLATWAQRIGVDIVRGGGGADPASVAFDGAQAALARNVDVLIVDTAGRLHTDEGLMRELTKIHAVIQKKIPGAPHEVLLVLDATQGQNALVQARRFSESIPVTGIFLAKLDGTARGGIAVAIHDELGVPIKLVGTGERVEDVEGFDARIFVEGLVGG